MLYVNYVVVFSRDNTANHRSFTRPLLLIPGEARRTDGNGEGKEISMAYF